MQLTRPIPDSYWIDSGLFESATSVRGRLLAGEYPFARDRGEAERKLSALLAAGVSSFLDLTEEGEYGLIPYANVAREFAATPIHHRRMSIVDLGTPTSDEMVEILDYLDQSLAAGHTVYVHCFGGIGRTGTVVGCYLARHGVSGEQALDQIALWRKGTPDGSRWSPETVAQRRFVRNWPAGQ